MRLRHSLSPGLFALLVVLGFSSSFAQQSGSPTMPSSTPSSAPATDAVSFGGSKGIRFMENRGQIASTAGEPRPDILYVAQGKGIRIYFRKSGVSYVFVDIESGGPKSLRERLDDRADHHAGHRADPMPKPDTSLTVTTYRMDMDLVGANPDPLVTGEEPGAERLNFYLAHCPNGVTGVRTFARLVYHDIYPNIDLIYYSNDGGLKYDFVVRPGGRPSDIRMRYTGAEDLRAAVDGKVVASTPYGTVTEGTPLLYQKKDGSPASEKRATVRGGYSLDKNGVITFDVGGYDRSRALVIDPALLWFTYLGGTSTEYSWGWGGWGGGGWGNGGEGNTVAHDRSGNVIFTTTTASTDYPVTAGVAQTTKGSGAGVYDLAVSKFTARGALIWGTYYGGSGHDYGSGLAIDTHNNVVIGGWAGNGTFPVSANAFATTPGMNTGTDGALVKLDSNGVRVWATFLQGGSFYGVECDRTDNIVVVGYATSTMVASPGAFNTIPPPNLIYTGFISRFTPSGSRTWNTFYGGVPTNPNYDGVTSVAIDSNQQIVIVGTMRSNTFPTTAGAFQPGLAGLSDGFVAKLDTFGTPIWATAFGGMSEDYFSDVAVDVRNNVVCAGVTMSINLPLGANPMQGALSGSYDSFIAKFSTTGAFAWSTYYGGTNAEYSAGVSIDLGNHYWSTGQTQSNNIPVTPDAFQAAPREVNLIYGETYITKFDSAGVQQWGTYLGGSSWDYPSGLSTNFMGCVVGGTTMSNDLLVTSGAFQTTLRGTYDAFLVSFCDPSASVSVQRPTRFCQGDSTILSATPGFDTYRWSNGATTRSITVTQAGIYSVTAEVGTCSITTNAIPVTIYPVISRVVGAVGSTHLCTGDSVTLGIGGGMRAYEWSNGARTSTITVGAAGRYSVFYVDTNGCTNRSDTITVTLDARPTPTITSAGPLKACLGEEVVLDAGNGYSGYRWSTGDSSQHLHVTRSGTYWARVLNANGCWGDATPVVVKIFNKPSVKINPILPTVFCDGDSTILAATAGFVSYQWSNGATTPNVTIKKDGRYTVIVTDTNGCHDTAEATIKVTPRPTPTIRPNGPTRFCQGDSVILAASGGYSQYQWATGAQTQSIVVKQTGIYYVIATSDQGCPGISDTISVTVLPRPVASIAGPSSVCRSSLATYSVPAGNGLSYRWTVNGAGGAIQSGDGTNSITVQWGPSGSGTVALSVRNDSTGCSGDTLFRVEVGTSLTPVITASRSLSLCKGESVTLDAGAYASYSWSTGEKTRTITISEPGDYTVSVVDLKGCSGTSAPVSVKVNTPTTPTVAASNGGKLCPGGTIELSASGGYANYVWSNGALGQKITVGREGSYSVAVTDSNGCGAVSEPFEVQPQQVPTPSTNGPTVVCHHSTIGYSTTRIDGATYTWTVTGGSVVDGQGSDGITVRWGESGDGTIDVTVTTDAGCTASAGTLRVTIGDKLEPVVTPSGTVALCQGESVTLDAGGGYASYLWSTGETTRTITLQNPATVSVTVADSNGCSGTSPDVTVVAKPKPTPAIDPAGPIDLCEGDSVTLRTDAPYASYLWSNGATTPTIKVRRSGSYGVKVTNADGCSGDAASVTVTVHPLPAKPTIARRGDSLAASDATAAKYEWTFNGAPLAGSNATIIGTEPGLYTVTVANAAGCRATSSPYRVAGAPAISNHQVWIDTVSATVGDRVRLVMRVTPPIAESDSVSGYRAELHVDPRALFLHRSIGMESPAVAGGDPTRLRYRPDGGVTVERMPNGTMVVGSELFQLDLEGLVTGSPLNLVAIDSVVLAGNAVASVGGNGLVILSGCEMGADFGRLVRIESIRPNPASADAVIRYHAPAGASVTLRVVDAVGREQSAVDLPAGTGASQEARLRTDELPSGIYMLELRNGAERSVLPIIIKQ